MAGPNVQAYRKHWVPLESNSEVFTELSHKLGLHESLEFQDVLSLDDPELLGFLPRPVHALILVFPTSADYEEKLREENTDRGASDSHEADNDDVFFFKQTINNACATNSTFDNLRQNALHSSFNETALALEDNQELEQAYAEAAGQGDTEAPLDPTLEVDHHYICFVKSDENGHMYQLDGDRNGPIDLGKVEATEDALSDKCLDVIRGMMAEEGENLNFSLMALGRPEI